MSWGGGGQLAAEEADLGGVGVNVDGLNLLVRVSVVLNYYYVEVPTGTASVGFSRRRLTEYREDQAARPCSPQHQAEIMLDFRAADVDAEYTGSAGWE